MAKYEETQLGGIQVNPIVTTEANTVVLDFTSSDNSLDAHFLKHGSQNLSSRQLFEKAPARSQAGIWQLDQDTQLSHVLEQGTYEGTAVANDGSQIVHAAAIANGEGTFRAYLYDNTGSRTDPGIDLRLTIDLEAVSDENENIIT